MPPAGVAVTAEIAIAAPLQRTFETVVPIDLTRIMRGLGPLPAVRAVRDQTGAWDHVGATRTVELADGSELRERLTAFSAPTHFAYELSDITGTLRHLVHGVDGAWWFSGATRVTWTYVFRPRRGRAGVVRALVAPLWAIYQRRALELAAAEVMTG